MSEQNDGAGQSSDYSFSVEYSFTSILGTGAFLAGGYVGSRLVNFQSQKMTVAARAMADRKTFGHLS